MASRRQIQAAKRNIKKAQRVWDSMHYSVAEGKIPKKLESNGEIFNFYAKTNSQKRAISIANSIRNSGYKARAKQLDVGGKRVYLIYKGPRRKKTVYVKAGVGPKGHKHSSYTRHLSNWRGYGRREKPGRGKGR